MDPRDTDPLYVEGDLWDPRTGEFVPRGRPPLLAFILVGLSGAIVGALLMAAAVHASPPSSPSPEPSFVPVPSGTMSEAGPTSGTARIDSQPRQGPHPAATSPSFGVAVPSGVADGGSTAGPTSRPTPRPTPRPKPAPVARGPVIRGQASWCAPTPKYCHGWGGTARLAAVPTFRYGDRPYWVTVCRAGTRMCEQAKVVSFCACGNKIIDLTPYVFKRVCGGCDPVLVGVVLVTVRR